MDVCTPLCAACPTTSTTLLAAAAAGGGGPQLLRARLYDLESRKRARATNAVRSAAMGSGERNEKIRTYNFPQASTPACLPACVGHVGIQRATQRGT